MFEAVKENYHDQDFIIKAAAVGDYRPKETAINKIKKKDDNLVLELIKNDDILSYLGQHKTNQIICGFAMETENLIKNAKDKFIKKNCDLLVANSLKESGAGFKGDTNKVTLITADEIEEKNIMTKDEVAKTILYKLIEIKGEEKC